MRHERGQSIDQGVPGPPEPALVELDHGEKVDCKGKETRNEQLAVEDLATIRVPLGLHQLADAAVMQDVLPPMRHQDFQQ